MSDKTPAETPVVGPGSLRATFTIPYLINVRARIVMCAGRLGQHD